MINKIKKSITKSRFYGFISRNIEIVFIILTPLILTYIIVIKSNYASDFEELGINDIILNIFGVIFGLLLTAYGIIISIIPTISRDLLDTNAFKKVNGIFLVSLIFNLVVIINGFLIKFLEYNYLIYLQTLFSFVLISTLLIIIILMALLFEESKNNIPKNA